MAVLLAAALFTQTVFGAAQAGDDTVAAASEAGVPVEALLGAMASTGLDARPYLIGVGELAAPVPPFNARVACIEAKESQGVNTWNRHGSGAGGVMQYMPGTFYAHAAEMGHPEWSLWNPDQARAVAAHDLAMGRRSQWTVSGC